MTFTPAQVKLNHERATKAVERLNDKAWSGTRYGVELPEGQPAVIVRYARPFSSRFDAPYEEKFRYPTRIDQTIGWPTSYNNQYNAANMGTMCYGIDKAEETQQRKLEGLRKLENDVTKLEAELEEAQARVAARRTELGL